MVALKILRVLNKALIVAVIIVIISFVVPIVPCKTAPVIENPEYKWGVCKFPNPIQEPLLGISEKFWGAEQPITGLVVQFIIAFIITTVILLTIRRKTAKVLDLTNKK